jgi:hypothetical protein
MPGLTDAAGPADPPKLPQLIGAEYDRCEHKQCASSRKRWTSRERDQRAAEGRYTEPAGDEQTRQADQRA